jgi:predicted Rossmann-fold nucleotide-binding protein
MSNEEQIFGGHSLLNQVEGAEKLFLAGRRSRGADLESAVKIVLEFLRGFESFDFAKPCVTVFGSARFDEDHEYSKLARNMGAALADAGYTVMTGKLERFPMVAMGLDFWNQLRKFARETMLESGVISEDDIAFVHPVTSIEEALEIIRA